MRAESVFAFISLALTALFVWGAVAALRRARRRRREQFEETSAEELESRRDEERLRHDAADGAAELPTGAGSDADGEAESALESESETDRATVEAVSGSSEQGTLSERAAGADAALAHGLERTSVGLRERLAQVFGRHATIDPSSVNELEDALLAADVGVVLSTRLLDGLRVELGKRKTLSRDEVRATLARQLAAALAADTCGGDPLAFAGARPYVVLFVGVNGVGKTTTIGKVATLAKARGHAVVLAAGDTFRAAAVEQLEVWATRSGARLIRGEAGSDPASVIFNAIDHATKVGADLVLADTAGRLHTKTSLMDEIKKVKRSAGKARAGAPDETWLVVDATTGQNALHQAREFHAALGLTGIILTKLDGTAKGGVVVAIADALHLPVRFVGVGERPEDLRPFDAASFVAALFAP